LKCNAKTLLILTVLLLSTFSIPLVLATSWSWPSSIQFQLPASGSVIAFNQTTYFDTYTWDTWLATQITFTNIFTYPGPALASLGVNASNCNVTFNKINEANTTTFSIYQNTTGNSTITLSGFATQPDNVTVNGVTALETSYWNWDAGASTINFSIAYIIGASVQVSMYWVTGPALPPGTLYVSAYYDSSLLAVYVTATGPSGETRVGTTSSNMTYTLNWTDCTPGLWSVSAVYGGLSPSSNSGPQVVPSAGSASITLRWLSPVTPVVPTLNLLWQYLLAGNLIGFIFACYTVTMGQTIFVLIAILISVPLYVRLKNLTVLAIAWIVLGGVFIAAMPIVSPFAVLLVVLGVAAVIYKIFQHVT
jgi:hypothetical protein